MFNLLLALLLAGAAGGFLFWLGFINLGKFLNHCAPIRADILVVEGWLHDKALIQASQLFWEDDYACVITTGSPLIYGSFLSEYKTHAQLSAATLERLGLPPEKIVPVPCPSAAQFRTYTSALAVRQYLEHHQFKPKGINVFTMSCHARRSWLVYRRVFSSAGVTIGVLATRPESFDLNRWWKTSAGFRSVIGEFIAYLYARLISWKA